MATATILPHLDFGTSPTVPFSPITASTWTAHGTADKGAAVRTSGDGLYVSNLTGSNGFGYLLVDESTLPAAVVISSITFNVRHQVASGTSEIELYWLINDRSISPFSYLHLPWDAPHADGLLSSTVYETWTATVTTNPQTGAAWTRNDLLATTGNGGAGEYFGPGFVFPSGLADEYDIDFISLTVTYSLPWWTLVLPTMTLYFNGTQPSAFLLPYDLFSNGVFYPAGTSFTWTSATDPGNTGWWMTTDAFAGAVYVVPSTTRPAAPRGFTEITTFATGDANFYGGFPGVAAGFQNHLVYAPGGYTVGTTNPLLRIYDGAFDRPIATLPNTSAGTVPKAILTILTANGVVYVATYDTGSSSADWVGRVFSLDVESGQLTPVGLPLTTGHLPYALCWHAGRLWCGTHRQNSAVSGKIFSIRPGIDTDWTLDYTLSTSTTANCSSLWSYGGKLYVGTTNAAAAFAKVLVRDTAGAYTTSLTATGGAAAANNGFPAMVDFGGNLYASFYNADTPAVAKIYKYDGSSWTTAYTGSGTTILPYVGLFSDLTKLFALGGGVGKTGGILVTTNGVSWTDETVFLGSSSTGVPAFAAVVH